MVRGVLLGTELEMVLRGRGSRLIRIRSRNLIWF